MIRIDGVIYETLESALAALVVAKRVEIYNLPRKGNDNADREARRVRPMEAHRRLT